MVADSSSNPKASGWDRIGARFWLQGRASAKPDAADLDRFCAGVAPGDEVLVIGASTLDLIARLVDLGARTSVFDFSQVMVHDLVAHLADSRVAVHLADITQPPARRWVGAFDFVVSDRLVNRFDHAEAAAAVDTMLALCAPSGTVRTIVKLGLYPMDERMIALGRERGTLDDFYSEASQTIDFSRAGAVLDDALMPHGEIPRDLILAWYRARGAEKRFTTDEALALFPPGATQERASADPDACLVEFRRLPNVG